MQINHTENSNTIASHSNDFVADIQNKEVLKTIDPHIKVSLRKYYLMLLYGQKIPKKYRTLLLQHVKEIITSNE